MNLFWTQRQRTWKAKCTDSFGKRRCVASASVAVLRSGWVDRAPMDGCLGLKIVRYNGLLEILKLCRLLRALDSLRRRLLGRGRSLGVWGCRRLPQDSLKSAYVRVTSSNGRIRRRLASPNRAKMGTALRFSLCSERLQTTQSRPTRLTTTRRGAYADPHTTTISPQY